MNKWIFIATLFSVMLSAGALEAKEMFQPASVCEKNIKQSEAKIKKGLGLLWQDIDASVGVEFFLVVLRGNDRMPASENASSAEFYAQLLKGMKKTSGELASHGLKLNPKDVKNVEGLIAKLQKSEQCSQLVSSK